MTRPDVEKLFARQAEWQREQARRPWAEKLREAAAVCEFAARCGRRASSPAVPGEVGGRRSDVVAT